MELMITAGIITIDDKGYKEEDDYRGRIIKRYLENRGYQILRYRILKSDQVDLENEMKYMSDELKVNLILTTGGIACRPTDIVPEATRNIIIKEVNGIAEGIRCYNLQMSKNVMLSRGVAGIRGETLIVNLLENPKFLISSLDFAIETIEYGVEMVIDKIKDCVL
ncbi:molybdopterin-binding protein [Clostridium sp.]|uniref:molybdopterin-binding protein n=1 Tax=Clostridium sp. TaxID=1506 RepID=UPI0025B99DD5|nr:molybdopterin-binding protein [Clostridium sp.]